VDGIALWSFLFALTFFGLPLKGVLHCLEIKGQQTQGNKGQKANRTTEQTSIAQLVKYCCNTDWSNFPRTRSWTSDDHREEPNPHSSPHNVSRQPWCSQSLVTSAVVGRSGVPECNRVRTATLEAFPALILQSSVLLS
jgi:hypothetical protein